MNTMLTLTDRDTRKTATNLAIAATGRNTPWITGSLARTHRLSRLTAIIPLRNTTSDPLLIAGARFTLRKTITGVVRYIKDAAMTEKDCLRKTRGSRTTGNAQ